MADGAGSKRPNAAPPLLVDMAKTLQSVEGSRLM